MVKKTTKMRMVEIADKLNLPKATVERVINEYIDGMKLDILRGNDVNINGLFTLKAVEKPDGRKTVRGIVSTVLKAGVMEVSERWED